MQLVLFVVVIRSPQLLLFDEMEVVQPPAEHSFLVLEYPGEQGASQDRYLVVEVISGAV